MSQPILFSIGYGTRSGAQVLDLLQRYDIDLVVDVRTKPYSKFRPEFGREAFEASLGRQGLRYRYMGELLGGRPADPTCYIDGKVDYTLCRAAGFFQEGMADLYRAMAGAHRVCLFCSEEAPHMCHRSKMIGVAVSEAGGQIQHIDESGSLVEQQRVIDRLTGGQQALFGDGFVALTSRNRYDVPVASEENWYD